MELHYLDPCKDVRWQRFLDRRPDASVFHTPGWLEALRRTYGYEPVVYTTSPSGRDIVNGYAFCRVASWLTGRRLVSLPFSDHAAVFMNSPVDLEFLLSRLQEEVDKKNWRYVDIRPVGSKLPALSRFRESEIYYWHKLSLEIDLDALLSQFS